MPSKSIMKVKKAFQILLRLFLLFFQTLLLFIILYRIVPVPITPLVVKRGFPYEKDWIRYEAISANIKKAVIVAEDPKFPVHFGFDFEAIRESVEKARKKGTKPLGRSTITQQTAKNLFFTPDRSWIRKAIETPVALGLELFWTKKRILEVYLNIIEMGPRIYGIEAAAQHYYKKPAGKLTQSESAMIAVCLPNPILRNPLKPDKRLRKKHATIQRWMRGYELDEKLK